MSANKRYYVYTEFRLSFGVKRLPYRLFENPIMPWHF